MAKVIVLRTQRTIAQALSTEAPRQRIGADPAGPATRLQRHKIAEHPGISIYLLIRANGSCSVEYVGRLDDLSAAGCVTDNIATAVTGVHRYRGRVDEHGDSFRYHRLRARKTLPERFVVTRHFADLGAAIQLPGVVQALPSAKKEHAAEIARCASWVRPPQTNALLRLVAVDGHLV